MSTPCALDKDAKLEHLTALHEARRAYVRAVYRAETLWQEHLLAVDLSENGVFDDTGLNDSYARAEEARHAIRPAENAVAAKVAECHELGLDLGLDHLTASMVAAA